MTLRKNTTNKTEANKTAEAKRLSTPKVIRIHKEAGKKKDAYRLFPENIPEEQKGNFKDKGDGTFEILCVEGNEIAPLGSVIGWEKSDSTPTGYNVWVIGNADTNLIEKDGVFYTKPSIMKAEIVSDEFPEILKGAKNITRNADGSWSIKTDWGVSTGYPGKAYWVVYGIKEDGTYDANILTKTEESYKQYIVCNEAGEDIGYLCEKDPA